MSDKIAKPRYNLQKEEFGKRLKGMREALGISQGDLAIKINLLCATSYDRDNVSKWERGQAFPPINTIAALSDSLKTPITSFFIARENDSSRVTDLETIADQLSALKVNFSDDPQASFDLACLLLEETEFKLREKEMELKALKDKHQAVVDLIKSK